MSCPREFTACQHVIARDDVVQLNGTDGVNCDVANGKTLPFISMNDIGSLAETGLPSFSKFAYQMGKMAPDKPEEVWIEQHGRQIKNKEMRGLMEFFEEKNSHYTGVPIRVNGKAVATFCMIDRKHRDDMTSAETKAKVLSFADRAAAILAKRAENGKAAARTDGKGHANESLGGATGPIESAAEEPATANNGVLQLTKDTFAGDAADAPGASWAPVLFEAGAAVHLMWVQSTTCFRDGPPLRWNPGGSVFATRSADGGDSWEPARLVLAQAGGWPAVLANPPAAVETARGTRLVLPVWRERPRGHSHASAAAGCARDADGARGDAVASVLLSDDDARTWYAPASASASLHAPAGFGWLIEGAATALSAPLGVAVLYRTRAGVAYASSSADAGETWTPPRRLDALANPDSKLHALALGGGCQAVVANFHAKPSSPGSDRRRRERLGVAFSCGGGVDADSWVLAARLAGFDGYDGTRAHYPTLARWGDSGVMVAYSHDGYLFSLLRLADIQV